MKNDKDLGLICICAARYAMGRRTYVTKAVPEFIMRHADSLSENDLRVLRRDIRTEISRGNYGDPNIDLPCWEKLIEFINGVVEDNGDF